MKDTPQPSTTYYQTDMTRPVGLSSFLNAKNATKTPALPFQWLVFGHASVSNTNPCQMSVRNTFNFSQREKLKKANPNYFSI